VAIVFKAEYFTTFMPSHFMKPSSFTAIQPSIAESSASFIFIAKFIFLQTKPFRTGKLPVIKTSFDALTVEAVAGTLR
jgi:hypothetical protein